MRKKRVRPLKMMHFFFLVIVSSSLLLVSCVEDIVPEEEDPTTESGTSKKKKKKKKKKSKDDDSSSEDSDDDSSSDEYGYDCSNTITEDMESAAFIAELSSGTSNDPFVLCLEPGVEINGTASSELTLTQTNYTIVSKGGDLATLYYLKLDPSTDGEIRFEQVKLRDNDTHDEYAFMTAAESDYEFINVDVYASGSADCWQDDNDWPNYVIDMHIEDSTFKQSGSGNAINTFADRSQDVNLEIQNSYLEAALESVIFLDGGGDSEILIEDSVIRSIGVGCDTFCGDGFEAVDIDSVTIKNSSIYTFGGAGFKYTGRTSVGGAATIHLEDNEFVSDYSYSALWFGPGNNITLKDNLIEKGPESENDYFAIRIDENETYGENTINGSGNTFCSQSPNIAKFTKVTSPWSNPTWSGNWVEPDISANPACN